MDVGGSGFFGDSGGLSCLACLCPCIGVVLLVRYISLRRQKDKRTCSADFLKPVPGTVGTCSDDLESGASSSPSPTKPEHSKLRGSERNWQSPAPLNLDFAGGASPSSSSAASSPALMKQSSSETALLSKSGNKSEKGQPLPALPKEWKKGTKLATGQLPAPIVSSIPSPLDLPDPEKEGERKFDELDSLSSKDGHYCSSDEDSVGDDEAAIAKPTAMPPARPGSLGQQGSLCSIHRYKTLGCNSCNGITLRPSPNYLRAAAARARVPLLDLSSITGEPAAETTPVLDSQQTVLSPISSPKQGAPLALPLALKNSSMAALPLPSSLQNSAVASSPLPPAPAIAAHPSRKPFKKRTETKSPLEQPAKVARKSRQSFKQQRAPSPNPSGLASSPAPGKDGPNALKEGCESTTSGRIVRPFQPKRSKDKSEKGNKAGASKRELLMQSSTSTATPGCSGSSIETLE